VDQSHTRNQTRGVPPQSKPRVRRDIYDEELYDDVWPSRLPSSVRRYHSDVRAEGGRTTTDVQSNSLRNERPSYPGHRASIPPRRTSTAIPAVQVSQGGRRRAAERIADTEEIVPKRSEELTTQYQRGTARPHWLVLVGASMLVMLVAWIAFSSLMTWWQGVQEDWQYGRPRTYQTDAVVGHNDSASNPSHFIALNLHRHIEIIEFPGGDATKAKVYIGPVLMGAGQDLAPVTLTFKDVNGDNKPDMIVTVEGSRFVFINDGGQFRPLRPGEKVQF
jgi:hypothetical protein